MTIEEAVEYIKTYNIYEYINKFYNHIKFKKSGNVYQSICPFHNDKNPSFTLFPNTGTFKCFGCGIHGDLIQFVRYIEKKDFKSAVETICCNLNIDVAYKTDNPKMMEYKNIMTSHCNRYYNNLKFSDRAKNYLKFKRKLNEDTILKFGLGYVTNDEHKYRPDFSFISDRISFPIIHNNKCVGMGYRAIEDVEPKYINDKNCEYFVKGDYLYGLDMAKDSILKHDNVYVVEGYMDKLYMYQSDIHNVVSIMGTAFTENQGLLLKKYTKNLVLMLDNDDAGNENTLRILPTLLSLGFNVKLLMLSDGTDPGEICLKYDFCKDKILNFINSRLMYGVQYIINKYTSQYDDKILELKRNVLENVTPILNSIQDPNDKMLYTSLIKKKIDL